jgi:hypothetical protein
MRGFDRPWYVAGGWAIDLFLKQVTRPHADLEIAIFRKDQRELRRHLAGWEFTKVVQRPYGAMLRPWVDGEWLAPPIHEIHTQRALGEPPLLEFLLNETDEGFWRFRRNMEVERPLLAIGIVSAQGVPFLTPEIVLLYKAKASRPGDEADFARTVAALGRRRSRWLRRAIEQCHPGHPWLTRLATEVPDAPASR